MTTRFLWLPGQARNGINEGLRAGACVYAVVPCPVQPINNRAFGIMDATFKQTRRQPPVTFRHKAFLLLFS